ncbi:ATP-binding protein [Streptomyces sp. NPDC058398]|uniref:ATP-binding protein n=1 Tax=Streptomyces sp. NPDC058398 TaxID=3346479 RepID=UPI00365C5393
MDQPLDNNGAGQQGAPSVKETSLALDGDGSPIAQARHLAAAFLEKMRTAHGVPVVTATVQIVQLIVSELVTNARKYAPGPALLRLRMVGNVLHVELWDSNPVLPTTKTPNPTRVGQHGMEIVAALAQKVTIEATSAGKRITAYVALSPAGTS